MKRIINIFIIIVFSFSFIFASIQLNIKNVEASANKVITFVARKSAVKTMSFVVEKKAKKTLSDMATKKVSDDVAKNYLKKDNTFLLVRNAQDKKVYNLKELDKMTSAEQMRLFSSVERTVERELLFTHESSRLFLDIVDFFTDYRLIASGLSLLSGIISGTAKKELESLTFTALNDAGLLYPAMPINANSNKYESINTGRQWGIDTSYTYEIPDVYVAPELDLSGELDGGMYYYSDMQVLESNFFDNTFVIDFDNKYGFKNNEDFYFDFMLIGQNENMSTLGFEYHDSDYIGYKKIGSSLEIFDSDYNDALFDRRTFHYLNGKLVYQSNDVFSHEFITNETIENLIKNMKRLTIISPFAVGDLYKFVIDVTDFNNTYRIVEYFKIQDKLDLVFNGHWFQLVSDINYDAKFNVKKIDNTEHVSEVKPLPKKDEVTISDSDFDIKDNLKIPNITEIPLKDKQGNDLEIIVTPEDDIEIVNPSNPSEPITNPDDIVIGNPNPDLIPELPSEDVDYTPDVPDDDIPPPDSEFKCDAKLDLDKFKSIANDFTHTFPFSIPWDIFRAIEAVFGGLESENKLSVTLPIGNTDFVIKVPDFFDKWQKFVKGFILIIWDLSIIYALRKWWGASE